MPSVRTIVVPPPNYTTSDIRTCLTIFIIILVILASLFTLKYIFLKHRQAASTPMMCPTDLSHSSITVSINSLQHNNPMAAVLVGFFGSPIWETRVNKPTLTYNEFSSCFYRSHTTSRRRPAHPWHELSVQNPVCHQSTSSLSGSPGDRAINNSSVRHRIDSFQWPIHPGKQRARSESASHSVRSYSTSPIRKRSRSLGAETQQRDEKSRIPLVPDVPSTRLVQPHFSSGHITSSHSVISGSSVLPVGDACILHSDSRSGSLIGRPSQVLGNTHASPVPSLDCVPGDNASPGDTHNFSSARQVLSQLNGSVHSTAPGSLPPRSNASQMVSSPFYPHPITAQKRARKEYVPRIRRIPAPGPSPLRTMILPEATSSDIDSMVDHMKTSDKENQRRDYDLGSKTSLTTTPRQLSRTLEHQSVNLDNSGTESPTPSAYLPHKQIHAPLKRQDSSVLLGIIRDLVEETKVWDPSLFMDENFKSLISYSGALDTLDHSPLNLSHSPLSDTSNPDSWQESGWYDRLSLSDRSVTFFASE